MSKIKNQTVQPESTSAGEGGVHRRRFVRVAGILVPAALTITSRSASAAGCLSASASASINLANSRPNRVADGVCSGRNITYWKSVTATSEQFVFAQKFNAIYSGGPDQSMVQVMTVNADILSSHLAAAWCNFYKGYVDPKIISLATLQSMWAGKNGSFQPIPGNTSVVWSATQMVTFLQTTQLT